MKVTDIYESKTCSRCAGTGRVPHISTLDDSRCFGCGGTGRKLTAKGQADYKRYQAAYKAAMLFKRPIDLQPGDKIKTYTEGRGPWYTVSAVNECTLVQPNGQRLVWIDMNDNPSRYGAWPEQLIWVHPGKGNLPLPAAFDSRTQPD